MKSHERHVSMLSSCLLIALMMLFLPSARAADNAIERCVEAIESVKSFDVVTTNEALFFSPGGDPQMDQAPQVVNATTDRDVFAAGLGLRLEDTIGTSNYSIGILDLRKAHPGEVFLHAFRRYGFYINPTVDPDNGRELRNVCFLLDLLKDPASQIKPLEDTNSALASFRVDNPRLHDQYVCLWLDGEHSYLPAKVEWHLRIENITINGPLTLVRRMEINKFEQIDGKLWVPIGASVVELAAFGARKGHPLVGYRMKVDLAHSSWNSVASDDLFQAKSVTNVNFEQDGWKYDYSPFRLIVAKRFVSPLTPAQPSVYPHRVTTGTILIMTTAIALLIISVVAARRRRGLP